MRNWKSKTKKNLAILGVMVLLCSLVTGLAPQAQEPEPAAVDGAASPSSWGDDGTLEVGVEWINDFPGTADDRSHWDESCDGLYYDLLNEGWTGRFRWTDWGAWEEDWKRAARGGFEESYVDNVDIAMLCTHGSGTWDDFWARNLSSVYFGSTVDDHHLIPGDIYEAYGDKDAEWVAFDSCSVLRDDSKAYWAAGMDNLHLLLGFKNTMYVIGYGDGKRWAEYMQGSKFCFLGTCWWLRSPYTITQAWFETIDDLQPGGVCGRVLAEENVNYSDYLWGKGSVAADYVDGDYFWLDHCSCTPPPARLPAEVVNQVETMPVVDVVDRLVNEEFVLEIARAFPELTGGEVVSDTLNFYMINATQGMTYTLQVDKITGGYKFRNQSQVWSAPVDPPVLPLEGQAMELANAFFTGAGANLPAGGAEYRNGDTLFKTESMTETTKLAPEASSREERQISTVPVQASLSFGREIPVTIGLKTRATVQTNVSVVGPGGRTKLYFGDQEEILGVQGGSRDIQFTGEEVTIMDALTAWDRFLQDPTIALAQVPWPADQIIQTGYTLGYYEQPYIQGQSHMIPTWVFNGSLSTPARAQQTEEFLVYVPASAAYMPPVVSITAPLPDSAFRHGQIVTFQGQAQEGTPPYTYDWYSSVDGFLGSGETLQAPLSGLAGKGEVVVHTISLEVTDANGQKRTATETVRVSAPVYLPIMLRQ